LVKNGTSIYVAEDSDVRIKLVSSTIDKIVPIKALSVRNSPP
jgi:hypothetical protein